MNVYDLVGLICLLIAVIFYKTDSIPYDTAYFLALSFNSIALYLFGKSLYIHFKEFFNGKNKKTQKS